MRAAEVAMAGALSARSPARLPATTELGQSGERIYAQLSNSNSAQPKPAVGAARGASIN